MLKCVQGLGVGHQPTLQLSQIGSGGVVLRAMIVGDIAADLSVDLVTATSELRQRLTSYPGAADGLVVRTQERTGRQGEPQVEVEWRDSDDEVIPVNRVAPGLGGLNSGAYLHPALNEAGNVLPPLSIWWAILLTLSSLARYHPEQWNDALDRDKSLTAIPIEEALEIGREILPWMFVHALAAAKD